MYKRQEQPHATEVTLTGSLAAAYANYKTNRDALEYYRRHVLPDQVRYYRGVYARRQIDPLAAFGDLVQAQQTLVANVTTYLSTLGSFWTSVVQIAGLMQTDDLFQLGQPEELPEVPDLESLPHWSCQHGTGSGCAPAGPEPRPATADEGGPARIRLGGRPALEGPVR